MMCHNCGFKLSAPELPCPNCGKQHSMDVVIRDINVTRGYVIVLKDKNGAARGFEKVLGSRYYLEQGVALAVLEHREPEVRAAYMVKPMLMSFEEGV